MYLPKTYELAAKLIGDIAQPDRLLRILDIGTYDGVFPMYLRSIGHEGFGVDLSLNNVLDAAIQEGIVKYAEKSFDVFGTDFDVILANRVMSRNAMSSMFAAKLQGLSYSDIEILARGVDMERDEALRENNESILRNAYEVLAPGGYFLCVEPFAGTPEFTPDDARTLQYGVQLFTENYVKLQKAW